MSKHFNELTPAQAERLAILSEEMGEAQQAIGKILRHGFDSHNPDFPLSESPDTVTHSVSNRSMLEKEIGDVFFAIDMLCVRDLSISKIYYSRNNKPERMKPYLHHQKEEV